MHTCTALLLPLPSAGVDASIRTVCSKGASCQAVNVNMDRQRLSPADSEGASHSHSSVEKPLPATFSDAIDAIGMGQFQNRLLLVCGMVSLCLFPMKELPRASCRERAFSALYGLDM